VHGADNSAAAGEVQAGCSFIIRPRHRAMHPRTQLTTSAATTFNTHVAYVVSVALCCLVVLNELHAQNRPAPVRASQEQRIALISQPALLGKVRTLADRLTRTDRFSGVILLAQNGSTVFEQAYGFADRELKRRNTATTTFNVSSVGKLFTQVAVAQLVAAGTLSLDSTISAYWPDYPDSVAARKVTIRHLLTHRSGIDGNIFRNPLTLRSNHDNVPNATGNPLAFEPGSQQQYSNAGYVVLGEIIERVSHEPYAEYIRRHLFAPTGMTASGFPAIDSLPPNAAAGYTRGVDEDAAPPAVLPALKRSAPVQPRRGSAAGGAYSNVGDLLRFVLARRNGALGIPPRRSQEMAAGGSPGSNAMVAEGFPDGYDVIVLSNFDPPAAGAIADSVERWLGGGGDRGGPGDVRVGGPRIIRRGPGVAAGGPPDAPRGPITKELPDTPIGRVAKDYLRAFASGDTAVMRAFIQEHMMPGGRTLSERIARFVEIFGENGALTLTGVQGATETELTMLVTGARSGPLNVILNTEAGPPFRITSLAFRLER
jgi:CubicO group peptidase (beta-lactamase class C family)